MQSIIITTCIVGFIVIMASFYHLIRAKAKSEQIAKDAIEQQNDTQRKWELVSDLTAETIQSIEVIQEETNVCKIEVERAAVADSSGWYNERLPDGVRDVLLKCTCDPNKTHSDIMQDSGCSEADGDK